MYVLLIIWSVFVNSGNCQKTYPDLRVYSVGSDDLGHYRYVDDRYVKLDPTLPKSNLFNVPNADPRYSNQNYRYPTYSGTAMDEVSRLHYENDNDLGLPGVLGRWRPDLQGKRRMDAVQREKDVVVLTSLGQVQGFKVFLFDSPSPDFHSEAEPIERIQGTVSVFLGIPYALPPVGDARFRPPRPVTSWHSLVAVDYKPSCPQPVQYVPSIDNMPFMNEDCLYLNIFSPSTKSGSLKLYPVMIYIHGGEFSHGSGNKFPGHVMAAFYEVVIVTVNYRLGALGFLSTGDYNSPGNYGILDQAMAVRWVYENIVSFNGDRSSITLFGPDAGAASAGLLMVNPRTREYIKRVIAQSGSAVSDWALIQDRWRAENTSKVFAQHLGCSIESSWKIVDCLKRGRTAYEIGVADFKPAIGMIPWGPVLDINVTLPGDWYEGWFGASWHFTNETMEDLIDRRKFHKNLSYMTGVTTQEAAYMIFNNKSLEPYFEVGEMFMEEKMREFVLRYNYTLNSKGAYEALKFMYTYWPDPHCSTCIRDQYIKMMSDFLYVSGHDKITKLLLKQNVPVYQYVLNTTVEGFRLPEWRKVPHDIEYYFLIGAPFLDPEMLPVKQKLTKDVWTRNDRNMSHFFMQAYTNFAKYGDPTYTQILGIHFEQAVVGQVKYLNINTTYNTSIMFNYRQTESAFWTFYMPTVVGHVLPIYYPYSDLWWLQSSPIHYAFWSVSLLCMLLLAVTAIVCMLWMNSKREIDHYFNDDFLTLEKETEMQGIGSRSESNGNIYEYRDAPSGKMRSASTSSLKTDVSTISAKEYPMMISGSPKGSRRPKEFQRPKTIETKEGVPQTAV